MSCRVGPAGEKSEGRWQSSVERSSGCVVSSPFLRPLYLSPGRRRYGNSLMCTLLIQEPITYIAAEWSTFNASVTVMENFYGMRPSPLAS